MPITLVPFGDAHLEPAAALLASRHQRDRAWAPDLSPQFEDPAANRPVLQQLCAQDGMDGVAALRDDRLVGFMLGAPELGVPTGAWAGMMRPRSAEIAYAGSTADRDDGALCRAMYADLAARWLTQGITAHYITIPANRETAETWSDLGFGRYIELGVRDTEPSAPAPLTTTRDLAVRRATAADEDAVQTLLTEMFRAWSSPPAFILFLPETTAARRQFIAALLDDPVSPHWLAIAGNRVVGMQVFTEPASPHWFVSTLQTPPQSVYLFLASTLPEERGRGVGTALLAHTIAWAREAGYARCMAHYVTATPAAAFWRKQGFRPVSHWLSRTLDERALWGCEQASPL
jgi:GNAT superfamily N-acetyltransferase